MHRQSRVPYPVDEERRLAALHDYALLDTPSEAVFNSYVALAAHVCKTPIAYIALIDRDRQWLKAQKGLDGVLEIARDGAANIDETESSGLLESHDLSLDARFAHDPLLRLVPDARFYAAVPLRPADGQTLGTLSVVGRESRKLSADQRTVLTMLAGSIVEQFELRRAQARLLDRSEAELYEIDPATRRLEIVNDATRRKLEYSQEEARGLSLGDVMPELGATGEFDRRTGQLRYGDGDGERNATRVSVRRKSGSTYPVDLYFERVIRGGDERILAIGTDVSKAVAAAQRVAMLSAAIDATQDAVMIATPGVGVEDNGTIVQVSEAFLRETRARREDVIGQPVDTFFGPRTDRDVIALMRQTLRSTFSARAQYVAYRRDGSEFYCETAARALLGDDGTIAHVVYVARDVSDAVVRGMSLEVINERLTTLTQVARNLFSSLDPRALVDAIVQGVTELTGGAAAQVLARGTGGEFIQTRDLLSQAITAVANDDFVRAAAKHDGVLLSGDWQRAGVPIYAPSGMVSYILDIRAGGRPFAATDAFALGLLGQYFAVAVRNVELYGELASRRAAVIELNQVKNDLIAMLAHDFKGPLTTIVGLADVLAEDERFDAESRQFLGMINSSAMRLASLATDTLALSRLEQNELTLRFDRVDVAALLRDIVRVLGVTRTIDMRTASDVMIVRADALRLRQVFENLVGNAIKYSPRGETVAVILREKRAGIEVAIRDRGIGIPARDISKLFGRFARGSNARQLGIGGTGFGLYLARTIVEMHGGQITVESKEGAGSTFRVLVPTVPAPQRTLDRRILLLDSEDEGRSFIAHTLRDEGYAVLAVSSESELLEALDDGRFDVVIVDVARLVITEAQLVERIAHRATLVRLVTTSESGGTGWNAALRKPFLIKDLAVVLESAVAERRRAPRRSAKER